MMMRRRNNANDFHGSVPWHKCKICTSPRLRLSSDYKTQYVAGFFSKKETKLVFVGITYIVENLGGNICI